MRHVLALAEHGSFARAALALRLSQPALSRSIQGLERQISAELFLRSAVGVAPTDMGRVFIQRARQVVQLAEDLDQEVVSNRSLQSGQITVGGGPYPADSTLSSALIRFIAAYPHVGVRLQVRDWDELLHRLRTRELNFFLAEISTLHQEHDLDIEPMSAHPLYFVARTGHPLAVRVRGSVTPLDTLSYPFISPARIPPRVLEPMLAAQRKARDSAVATRAFPSLECNSLSAVKRIVAGSDAITAVTLTCVAEELSAGKFVLLGAEPWLELRYGLVKLKGLPMISAAEKFREFVINAEIDITRAEERLAAELSIGPADRRGARPASRAGSMK